MLAFLTALLTGCAKEDFGNDEAAPANGKVALTFHVAVPKTQVSTRAMGDKFTFSEGTDHLRVAVFSIAGYLSEYVEASSVTKNEALTNQVDDAVNVYDFKVLLSIDPNAVSAHLIINGPEALPFKSEAESMASAYSQNGVDAYWQRIDLSGIGIDIKRKLNESSGIMEPVLDSEGNYTMSDETKARFSPSNTVNGKTINAIEMIRNYAKIVVKSTTDDFEAESIYLVNAPDKGSVAPYNASGNFMTAYGSLDYSAIKSSYSGFMPSNTKCETEISESLDYTSFTPAGEGVYLYERTAPTGNDKNATFLLVYGTYKANGTSSKCYYKLDLSDTEGYYTIYRNFIYEITISGVQKKGQSTASDAITSGGSGDLSHDTNASKLDDVSNGYSRIVVSYTDSTIISGGSGVSGLILKYKYFPDAASSTVANDKASISINQGGLTGNVLSSENGTSQYGGTVNGNSSTGYLEVMGSNENNTTDNDWRRIYYSTTAPSNAAKAQTIVITGGEGSSAISRTITLRLLPMQILTVECLDPTLDHVLDTTYIKKETGSAVDVKVSIPNDLPESMFPLIFTLESDAGSITPREGDNLPVTSGKTIDTKTSNTSKVAIQYHKTLTYDEYVAAENQSTGKASFICKFKTNKSASACKVYVANKYFVTGDDGFANFTTHQFTDVVNGYHTFVKDIAEKDQSFATTITMESGHVPSTVIVYLSGLEEDYENDSERELIPISGVTGYYTYTTGGNNTFDLKLKTTTDDSSYYMTLSTDFNAIPDNVYDPLTLHSLYKFTNLKFSSDTVKTNRKNLTFSFDIDPEYIPERIYLDLDGLSDNDDNLRWDDSSRKYYIETNGSTHYTVNLLTSIPWYSSGSNGYSVALSADNYRDNSLYSSFGTIDFSYKDFDSNDQSETRGPVTISFKGSIQQQGGWYNNLEVSSGNNITVSASNGKKITKIVIKYSSNYYGLREGQIACSDPTGKYQYSWSTGTWTVSSSNVILTTNQGTYITSMEVTYE